MFGRGAKEEIYIVREDADGNSWVQFGDGITGARLPSGIDNIVAAFRSGTGAYGALKEETTVQVRGRLDRFDKAHLPGVATGGDVPESGDNAREAAPGKIQSLDRLVSLKDFESETLAIAGVSKALAAWDLVDNVPSVVLTVLMETGREQEFQQVQQIVADSNRCRGPQRFPVCVRQGLRQYVYMDAVYGLHPNYREEPVQKAIKKALGLTGEEDNSSMVAVGLFALRNRNFGQDEYASRIAAAIQNVDGVLWVKITALRLLANDADDPSENDSCSFSAASDPSELILLAEQKDLSAVIACNSRHILSLFTEHLQLSPVSVPSAEVC
jgi:predicted phage baseplate assembly protein